MFNNVSSILELSVAQLKVLNQFDFFTSLISNYIVIPHNVMLVRTKFHAVLNVYKNFQILI